MPLRRIPPGAALALAMVVAGALLLHLGRGQTFHYDEWDFVTLRTAGGFEDEFLRPHNEHIAILPIFVYKVLLNATGLDDHWLLRTLLVLMHLGVGLLVWLMARRRIGPWPAVVAALPILFLGRAHEDLLWGFQIGFVGSVLLGLAAWWALDFDSRRADIVAAVALTGALSSSSLGIPIAIGMLVEIAAGRRWRRLPVALAPATLYAIWYIVYGQSTLLTDSIFIGWDWALDASAAATGALLGQGLEWGRPLVAALFVLLLWRLGRPGWVTPRLLGLLAAAASFWVLTGVARAQLPPETSRYVYLGAVLVLLAIVEGLRAVDYPPRMPAIAAGVVLLGAWLGLPELRAGSHRLRDSAAAIRAELAAIELQSGRVGPGFYFDPARAPTLNAGNYLAAVDGYDSSPALPVEGLPSAGPIPRGEADRVLIQSNAIVSDVGDVKIARGVAPEVEGSSDGSMTRDGGCVRLRPLGEGSAKLVVALRGKIAVTASTEPVWLRARRFASGFPRDAFGGIGSGNTTSLSAVPDRSPAPWHLQAESNGALTACRVA